MSNVIDYDQFRAEAEGEKRVFRINGHDYPMAQQVPAVLVLKVLRLKADVGKDADVTVEVFDDLGRSCFGSETWDKILIENQIGFGEIPKLMEAVIKSYAPKATPRQLTSDHKASSSPSSKRGRGSKRTSSASTRSTSSKT